MTPAEELREAARLMRERAQAATPGPWKDDGSPSCVVFRPESTRGVAWCSNGTRDEDLANSAHIASWHPLVALAVADWLDRFSDKLYCYGPAEFDHALIVARAYLAPVLRDVKEDGR